MHAVKALVGDASSGMVEGFVDTQQRSLLGRRRQIACSPRCGKIDPDQPWQSRLAPATHPSRVSPRSRPLKYIFIRARYSHGLGRLPPKLLTSHSTLETIILLSNFDIMSRDASLTPSIPSSPPRPSSTSPASFHTAPPSPYSSLQVEVPSYEAEFRNRRYRKSIPISAEIRNHCHIFFDELLCTFFSIHCKLPYRSPN